MLKVMRDNLKYLSWVLWVVILVFVLFVFVDFGRGVPGERGSQEAAATVGGQPITYAEFRREHQQLERQFEQAYGDAFTPELARQMRLPLQALDRLIAQHILLEEAERLQLEVTDEEVRREILAMDVFRDEQGTFVGEDLYAQILAQNGYTVSSFEQMVRRQALLQKMQSVIAQTVYVSEREVEAAYREQVERATIRYVQLPIGEQPLASPPSDEMLRAWYDSHQDQFQLPERRIAAYALVDVNALRATLDVPAADIQAWYESHQDDYRREEEVRARHILVAANETRSEAEAEARARELARRIEAGEDWAAVAAANSDDPSNKDRGGDLGWFARGAMVPEFSDAAFAATPGTTVGPVKTSYGYHLIQVQERRPAGIRPLAEVESEIRARLAAERAQAAAESKAAAIAAKLRDAGAKNVDAVRAAVGIDPAVTVEATPPFGARDAVPGIGRGAFATAVFGLGEGAVSEPVRVPRGYAVAVLQEIQPPRLQSFDEVSAQVRGNLERELRSEAAKARLEAAKAQLAAGKSFEEVAADLGLMITDSPEFGTNGIVGGLGVQPELARVAFSTEEGQFGGPVVAGAGPVLFQVVSRTRVDPAQFQAARAETRSRLENERSSRLLASLIAQRRRDLNVQYDRRLVEELGILDQTGA